LKAELGATTIPGRLKIFSVGEAIVTGPLHYC